MNTEHAGDMKRAQVAIIATPALGNLVPIVEFATLLSNHHRHRISVVILTISIPQRPLIDDYLQSRTSTQHIRFIELRPLSPPPLPHQLNSTIEFISLYIESHKSVVKQTLEDLTAGAGDDSVPLPLVGLFIDMFCTSMIDVAKDLNIPSYLFFASPAAYLGFVLHLTTFPATESFHSVTELAVPSYANRVPSTAFPSFCIKKLEIGYSSFVGHALRYKETKGVVINTFQELEPYAIDSLASGYMDLPRVYPVGPIIDHIGPAKWHPNRSGHEKTIEWLNRQPSSSVVFLCFGSMGSLNREQVREIATGLERAGFRFLWTLREPAKAKLELPNDYKFVDENLFPDGFIDRTAEMGLVCGWVPQVSVLAHRAIGGFVSHCGWNSILESIWYGVPIATWPLYAEQQLNAFEMVKELGLGVEVKMGMTNHESRNCDVDKNMTGHVSFNLKGSQSTGYGCNLVMAEEVERCVRELMGRGNGDLRKKMEEMSEKSKAALMENGSSLRALEDLVNALLSIV